MITTSLLRRSLGRVLPGKMNAGLRSLADSLLYPPDLTGADRALYESVAPYTMTSVERVVTLASYVRSVVARGVPGDLVECGVWRGGSAMCMARTLLACGAHDRHLYLFDTFQGMTNPTEVDVSVHGARARDMFAEETPIPSGVRSNKGGLLDVRKNLQSTGYPEQNLHFVQGRVEQTIPGAAPQAIALLRLDTDWYESTLHELRHLYGRVSAGGIVIIDDYGHWAGCRKAVDEFLATLEPAPVLHRIDYTCRSLVKP